MPLTLPTGDVTHVIQLAIAPVFLLTAVGTMLNVLVSRLSRSVDRRRVLVAALPANVRYLGHVYTCDHNALNCTPLAVLNINRESMARYGFSPATRVFGAVADSSTLIHGVHFIEPKYSAVSFISASDSCFAIVAIRFVAKSAVGRGSCLRIRSAAP